jgi:hypothetical protein
MTRLQADFKDFLKLLNAHRVDYLLIGGYAVGYHGYPRATVDLDVWIARVHDNAARVVSALHAFGFHDPVLTTDLFLKADQIIRMGTPPFRIEISTTISGVDFSTCHACRVEAVIDGLPVPVIDLANLRRNKKASGRFKDLDDLENLPEVDESTES